MRAMIFIFATMGFYSTNAYTQQVKGFTRSERSFIKHVVEIQGEKPLEITKRTDSHIVVEFEHTMVVLKPDGYIGEMWIRTDGDWMSIGTEQAAY